MRSRIAWLVVVSTATVVVAFVIPLCLLVRTLAEDRAMAAADQEARNVALLVAAVPQGRQLADLISGLDDGADPTTSVLTASGRQIGPGPAMRDDPDVTRARAGEAFRVVGPDGGAVLLPVVVGSGTTVVRSTVGAATLRDGVLPAWGGIVALGLALILLAVGVARRLGTRIAEPVREVARTAHRMREGDLEARADLAGPEETRELARALNGLAERTAELLATERATVGDMAHRLRTPVTALRLDAEGVGDPDLAERLQERIGVLQRTIDAIVAEARRPVRTELTARTDVAALVSARVAYWQPLAEDQGRAMQGRVEPGPLWVGVPEDDLRDLIDITIDNVFAHTPEGTPFSVDLVARRGREDPRPRAILRVVDQGPGFPEAWARAGTGGLPGPPRRAGTSGLGLDIADRVSRSVGGRVVRGHRSGGGAVVEVELPLLPEG